MYGLGTVALSNSQKRRCRRTRMDRIKEIVNIFDPLCWNCQARGKKEEAGEDEWK